ncbi:MAG: LamG domain-containing protein [candidate division WS1 bacterium]|jgi:hypothetical protein|nr:LamG domain-containing protein [candidate division WS1 bacterium]
MQILLRIALIATMLTGVVGGAVAADVSPEDVMLKVELQSWGVTRGIEPVAHEQASGGYAMSMAADALAVGGLDLAAGEYTLVLWQHAPAGDADGFFVEINGQRTRLLGSIGSWRTLTHPFEVAQAGPVTIAIIGQEPTMTVDMIAVVRGTYERGEIEFADIPGETVGESIGLADIPRLSSPRRLAQILEAPLTPDAQTVYVQSFDADCPGITGEHQWIDGPFGRAVILDMPDGRFSIDASELDITQSGTIEWWVKPREAARVWWDQGWHYFLHMAPAENGGLQFDLSRHPITGLLLTLTRDGEPYTLQEGEHEAVRMETGGVDIEQWHHMLVSWDFTGDRQYLWLMIDGVGMESFFPRSFEPTPFARIDLANTPANWDIPYLPMDGAIDEIRISNTSVADRLQR